ncbi:MAG: SGNH/GDSL hydrolase family protein [Bacteroidales bacterium]|nr:SGNH/GDSL hydrolase family protein [Bacteroidales bacterium]
MKKILAAALAVLLPFCVSLRAQTVYTEASSLTLTGKLFPDTPNPYHRVDTVRFKGFTTGENLQVRESSGLAVAFRTNSTFIRVKTEYGTIQYPMNTNGIAAKGYDLYIRKDGKWLFAAAGAKGNGNEDQELDLIKNLDGQMHECLMYLPLYSEVRSVKIGTSTGSVIEAIPNPFRHRVGIFGSSYTHGSSTSRGGMTYPAQFTRNTGIQLLSLGCSGNSKLQPYFADALSAADVEAFIFDSFSNPNPDQIRERLFPFIEKIQAAHPGKPLIFQRTIYRESRNFNTGSDASERAKMEMADSLMKIACKKYKDVYYIYPDATSPDHLASVDGTHPTNYGYTLWAKSIEKKVLRILKKYGIK